MLGRVPLIIAVMAQHAASLNNAWRRRGVYRDRRDMPPLDAVAAAIGADAPWAAPKWVWALCWRTHARLLPVLHARDGLTNTCVNLQVLWLKALGGDDAAYALLPRGARLLVAPPLRRLYPKLHHQNIRLRAKFLDDAVRGELRRCDDDVAVVALGAGFDGRAARAVAGRGPRARAADVDLPAVIAQKRGVLSRTGGSGAELIACDLAGDGVAAALARAIANRTAVIFVIEALMIYLDPEAAARLLDACCGVSSASVSLCFADRLRMEGVDEAAAALVLADRGFDLVQYIPKPGLARHMGVARRREG
jgi:hypothetical protein